MIATLYALEGLTRRPRLIDVDDAIHLFRRGWTAKGLAELVVVGNDWLAETWRQWNAKVEILPTAVDTRFFNVRPLPERPSIGWIGSFGNLRYLENTAPALVEWVAALSSILTDRRGAEELGAAGRRKFIRDIDWRH
jgi:hypothetical protein